MDFNAIDPRLIQDNVFKLVGEDWMLITSGELDHFNTMTASWGGLGILWSRRVVSCGLTPVEASPGWVSFKEAQLILACKKLYFHDLNPAHFIEPTLSDVYPAKDYHRMYIGEVMQCLSRSSNG